jgi:hypothetical protein
VQQIKRGKKRQRKIVHIYQEFRDTQLETEGRFRLTNDSTLQITKKLKNKEIIPELFWKMKGQHLIIKTPGFF